MPELSAPTPARGAARAESGTVDKAIDVLFHLHREPGAQGVTALARALGLPKSSAHRLLTALVRRGLVERDEAGRYRLGPALVTLGLGVLDREPVLAAARPLLEREAAALGETCFLVVARAGRLLVVDKAEGSGFLRASPRVGAEVPAHATAVGKLYCALAPEVLSGDGDGAVGGERFTAHTLAPAAFRDCLPQVARERVAYNRDEWIDGLSVLAVPIVVHERMRGALALAAATTRLEALGDQRVLARLRVAAAEVASRLGEVPDAGAGPGRARSVDERGGDER